jgi:hypothetical protein
LKPTKARLVVRGDQQIEGISYQDTFSPVMDMATTRIIFAFRVLWGDPPRHRYTPVAYKRASPEENLGIFIYPPQGIHFTVEEAASSDYGLNQAGRLWNQVLEEKLRE